MGSQDLGYRLEITMRSLASTRQPDGSITLSSDDARNLIDLLEGSAEVIRAFSDLRYRLLDVVNDPSRRSVTIPLRDVTAILRAEHQ